MNTTTQRKRSELLRFIQREVVPEACVQGVVAIGSVAKGTARDDSDIDAVVFLEPFDLYAVPAECKWQPESGEFHGIFSDVQDAIQLDFHRVDLAQWSQPGFEWPESLCAELLTGWVAFDRVGEVWPLIVERTHYGDEIRQERLDEAIAELDWLLSETTTDRTWALLGPEIAHYRLHVALDTLVGAVFAYNRCWRTLRSRELSDFLNLPWLPERVEAKLLLAMNALSETQDGYQQRATVLRDGFHQLVAQCQREGLYSENAVSEAFIRQHDEPGRDWNMDAWNRKHARSG